MMSRVKLRTRTAAIVTAFGLTLAAGCTIDHSSGGRLGMPAEVGATQPR